MPWREVAPMDERIRFVVEAESGAEPFAWLCDKYGVSRTTGYKWLQRYREVGLHGLGELSRAPRVCPHKTPIEMREAVVALRKARPGFGPKKIAVQLRGLGLAAPAPSTIAAIIKDAGLAEPRRKHNARLRGWPNKLTIPVEANHVWTVDYKGWFRLDNGQKCYPLTVMDLFSRFVVGCDALARPAFKPTWRSFERLFSRFGLPSIIRVDNGSPFAGCGAGGISHLSALWLRLGIDVEFTEPGKPQQNGAHERMHRTLKREVRKAWNLASQQRRFQAWRRIYNHQRGHEALGMVPPAQCYARSQRKYPSVIPDFSYPAEAVVWRVRPNGYITWNGRRHYINQALEGCTVRLVENAHGGTNVYAGSTFLGVLKNSGPEGLSRLSEPVRQHQV